MVYNTITRNDDPYNEGFVICGIDCYVDNLVEIYDQLGILVFRLKNYNNTNRNFKGLSNVGTHINQYNKLPKGTYYYNIEYLDLEGNSKSVGGWLFLMAN